MQADAQRVGRRREQLRRDALARGSPARARWRTRGPSAGRRSPPGTARGRRGPCRARRAPAPSPRRRAASRRRPARSPRRAAARCARAAARRSARRGGAPARGSAARGRSRRSSGAARTRPRRATRRAGCSPRRRRQARSRSPTAGAADDATHIAADPTERACATMGAWRAASPPPPSSVAAPSSSCSTPRSSAPRAGRPAFAFVERRVGRRQDAAAARVRARARARRARACCSASASSSAARRSPTRRWSPRCARSRAGSRPRRPRRCRSATRNALAELLPELGGTGTRADEEASARQGRLFEALLALLERLGRTGPVLLAIEDLHWADGATRDFITFLVRSAREEPLCLVVTYRSDELHRRHPLRPLLAELERAAGVDRLALERFDRDEARRAARRHPAGARRRPSSPSGSTRARRATRSTPRSCWRRSSTARAGCCPRRCATCCSRASSGSTPAAQAVVRVAAVLDRPATHALLEAVADLPPAEVMEGAREAVAHQVLVIDAARHVRVPPRAGRRGRARRPAARRGHRAARARSPGRSRRGRSCSATRPTPTVAAELACHWKSAHELSRSLGASVRAGLAAKRVYAYEVAAAPVRARARALGPRARRARSAPAWTTPRRCATRRPAPARAARRRAPSR